MTPVEDQQSTNSCAANATAGAYEYLIKRHLGEEAYDVSRLFIYYNARAADDAENIADEGSVLSRVIDGLKENGACSEETWPFDTESVNEAPSEDAYEEAKGFMIEETELVPTDLDAWKSAIAAGHPIIFGMKLFGSFDKHKKAGLVPMPFGRRGRERQPRRPRHALRGLLGSGRGVHRPQLVGARSGATRATATSPIAT
jgi:hypothetical protein